MSFGTCWASPDEGVRLRAAAKLIDLGVEVVEVADRERRVMDLEAKLEGTEP